MVDRACVFAFNIIVAREIRLAKTVQPLDSQLQQIAGGPAIMSCEAPTQVVKLHHCRSKLLSFHELEGTAVPLAGGSKSFVPPDRFCTPI